MAMLSNLDLIRRVPLFSLLTNDQAQGIADSVVKRRFRRGEIVVEHGKKSNALFILLTGRARVLTADSRGREVILAVLQSGDYVGVHGRVARTLLDMSEMEGEVKIIRNKVSRQDLAKVVGASREMVSRVMKDLEGRGMVQTQENGWVIIKEQLTG